MAVNWKIQVKWKTRKMQPIKTDTYTYILKKNKEKNIILYVLKNYPIIIKAQLPQKISSRYAFTSEFF